MENVLLSNKSSIDDSKVCYELYPYVQEFAKSVIYKYGYKYSDAIFMTANIEDDVATIRFLVGSKDISIFLSVKLGSDQSLIDSSIVSHDNYSY